MREYMRTALSMLAIICMIPGCAKQSVKKNKAVLPHKQAAFSFDSLETNIDIAAHTADYNDYNSETEAKLHDIPTMIGSVPVELPADIAVLEGQMMVVFASSYDQEMITNFYNAEMECKGWQRIACVKGFESTLVFQRPKKICIISIRPLTGKKKHSYLSLVHICTSKKDK